MFLKLSKYILPITLFTYIQLSSYCSAQNPILKGGVTHSESLPAVPEFLQSGNIFDISSLNKQKPKFLWVKIPNCLAGTWQSTQSRVINTKDNPYERIGSFKTYQDGIILGFQMDKNGGIWDSLVYPLFGYTNFNANTSYYTSEETTYQDIIDSSSNSLTYLFRIIELTINKSDHKIIKTYQKEVIFAASLIAANQLKVISSEKFFNIDGSYNHETCYETIYYKIKDFTPKIYGLNNFDYKKSFIDYLEHYNLQDLIPN